MSSFDDNFNAVGSGRDLLLDQFGRSVTYRPAGGDPVEVEAIVEDINGAESDSDDGRGHRRTRLVTVSAADAATPSLSDELDIDGQRWAVESIESQTRGMVRLRVVRHTVTEKARGGYRENRG